MRRVHRGAGPERIETRRVVRLRFRDGCRDSGRVDSRESRRSCRRESPACPGTSSHLRDGNPSRDRRRTPTHCRPYRRVRAREENCRRLPACRCRRRTSWRSWRRQVVTPRKLRRCALPCGQLPLGFVRQPLASRRAKRGCRLPRDERDGKVSVACGIRSADPRLQILAVVSIGSEPLARPLAMRVDEYS